MWADFPTYPLNLLADVNALFGLMNHWYLPESMHGGNLVDTISLDPSSPDYSPDTVVQTHGDTTYYLIPSKHLPLLYPLRWIGLGKVADVIEPLLKVFVELGYDRSAPMGQTVRAELFPRFTVEGVRQFVTDLRDASAQSGQAWAALFTPRKPATALPAPSPALTTRAAHAPTVRVSHATNVAAASAAKKDVTTPVPVSCAARAAGVGRYHAAAGSGAQTATRAGERN